MAREFDGPVEGIYVITNLSLLYYVNLSLKLPTFRNRLRSVRCGSFSSQRGQTMVFQSMLHKSWPLLIASKHVIHLMLVQLLFTAGETVQSLCGIGLLLLSVRVTI